MIADYCKVCVWWIMNRCDGTDSPDICRYRETYDDWDQSEELLKDFFEE